MRPLGIRLPKFISKKEMRREIGLGPYRKGQVVRFAEPGELRTRIGFVVSISITRDGRHLYDVTGHNGMVRDVDIIGVVDPAPAAVILTRPPREPEALARWLLS